MQSYYYKVTKEQLLDQFKKNNFLDALVDNIENFEAQVVESIPKNQLKAVEINDEVYKNLIKLNKLELELKNDIIQTKNEEIESLKLQLKMLKIVPTSNDKPKTIKVKKVKKETEEVKPIFDRELLKSIKLSYRHETDYEDFSGWKCDVDDDREDPYCATIAFDSVFF